MRSVTPSGQVFSTQSRRLPYLLAANAGHQHQPVYKTGASLFGHVGNQQDREESNPVKRLWRPPALPGARSCKADPSCRAWVGTLRLRLSGVQRSSTAHNSCIPFTLNGVTDNGTRRPAAAG